MKVCYGMSAMDIFSSSGITIPFILQENPNLLCDCMLYPEPITGGKCQNKQKEERRFYHQEIRER